MSRAHRSSRFARSHHAAEQDFLEGLPIWQWRQCLVPAAGPLAHLHPGAEPDDQFGSGADGPGPADAAAAAADDGPAWPDHPLPREIYQLPELSQQLLRMARSGRVARGTKRTAPPSGFDAARHHQDRDDLSDDGDSDAGAKDARAEPAEPGEGANPAGVDQSVYIRKWVQVPRKLEEQEPVYLAKRRAIGPDVASVKQQPLAVPDAASKANVGNAPSLVRESPLQAGQVSQGKSIMIKNEATGGSFQSVNSPQPPKQARPTAPAIRATLIRTIDPDGRPCIWQVLVPEDRSVHIPGEIPDATGAEAGASSDLNEEDQATLAALRTAAFERRLQSGAMIGGIGLVNRDGKLVSDTLLRRYRPQELGIAKRRGGPGRGRKKIIFRPVESDRDLLSGQPMSAANELAAAASAAATTVGSATEGTDADGDDGTETEAGAMTDLDPDQDDAVAVGPADPPAPAQPVKEEEPDVSMTDITPELPEEPMEEPPAEPAVVSDPARAASPSPKASPEPGARDDNDSAAAAEAVVSERSETAAGSPPRAASPEHAAIDSIPDGEAEGKNTSLSELLLEPGDVAATATPPPPQPAAAEPRREPTPPVTVGPEQEAEAPVAVAEIELAVTLAEPGLQVLEAPVEGAGGGVGEDMPVGDVGVLERVAEVAEPEPAAPNTESEAVAGVEAEDAGTEAEEAGTDAGRAADEQVPGDVVGEGEAGPDAEQEGETAQGGEGAEKEDAAAPAPVPEGEERQRMEESVEAGPGESAEQASGLGQTSGETTEGAVDEEVAGGGGEGKGSGETAQG